jgi:hypothetical protein
MAADVMWIVTHAEVNEWWSCSDAARADFEATPDCYHGAEPVR